MRGLGDGAGVREVDPDVVGVAVTFTKLADCERDWDRVGGRDAGDGVRDPVWVAV